MSRIERDFSRDEAGAAPLSAEEAAVLQDALRQAVAWAKGGKPDLGLELMREGLSAVEGHLGYVHWLAALRAYERLTALALMADDLHEGD